MTLILILPKLFQNYPHYQNYSNFRYRWNFLGVLAIVEHCHIVVDNILLLVWGKFFYVNNEVYNLVDS